MVLFQKFGWFWLEIATYSLRRNRHLATSLKSSGHVSIRSTNRNHVNPHRPDKPALCPSITDCALVIFGQLSSCWLADEGDWSTPATEAGGGTSPTKTGHRASVLGLLLQALVGAPLVTSTVLAGGRRRFAGGLSGSVRPSFILLTFLLYSTSGRPVRAPTTSSPPSLPLPFLSVFSSNVVSLSELTCLSKLPYHPN